MAQLRKFASGTGMIVALLVLNMINAAPQFPDWASQLATLQNQTGVTGIPAAGEISFLGAGGIPSYGDLQNQTLPGGNIGTGFWEQLQNQTIPSPPDVGQIQGVIPTQGSK